jgi:hypothetical protein
MITTVRKARNGTAVTPEPEPEPEPVTGLAYARRSVEAHTANIVHDAAYEATSLCMEIYRAASGAFTGDASDASAATEALTAPDMQDKIQEAYDCLGIARDYLIRLMHQDPPF